MRVFRICPAPGYLTEFRKRHGLAHNTFDEQIRALRAQNVILPGGWAAAMAAEGVEVFETIYQDWGLQARWARENGIDDHSLKDDFLFEVLKAQTRMLQPDVIFYYAGALTLLPRERREQLQSLCAKRVIATGLWGDELAHGNQYKGYFGDLDFVFCSSSAYKRKFDEAGVPSVLVGNCFDDTIAFHPATAKTNDFIFCGTTGFGYADHVGRYRKMLEFMARTKLEVWAFGERRYLSPRPALKSAMMNALSRMPEYALRTFKLVARGRLADVAKTALHLKLTGARAETIFDPNPHPLARYFDDKQPLGRLFPSRVHRSPLDASEYYALLSASRIVLNLHRDEPADIGNIRCFEATGLGACLLTDRGEELREFFDVENDIVSFTTVDECVMKLDYLLAHPTEIERIARNGQRATLAKHTVSQRCRVITKTLRQYAAKPTAPIVLATYDVNRHPISYDIAFFLQAADIFRQQRHAAGIVFNILWPSDIRNMAGVPKAADAIVDAHAREFRLFHICAQMAELMKPMAVISTANRMAANLLGEQVGIKLIAYPSPEVAHHAEYYQLVSRNPHLLTGFSATPEAHRFVKKWLNPIRSGRKVLCVTLRQYHVDTQRNSDLLEWRAFLDRINQAEFAVVVMPDTDHIAEFKASVLGEYPCYEPACFDIDLRMALYEQAYLNLFVNTGPAMAATLNKNIRYVLFKILVPGVPHCTRDFMELLGFKAGANPSYAGPLQQWVWEDDRRDIIWREFCAMVAKIERTPAIEPAIAAT